MRLPLTIALALAIAGATHAQERADSPRARPPYGPPITLDQAKIAGAAAEAEARRRGFRMTFAIVEPSGQLVWFMKMDDSQYGATDVAIQKAKHAALFRSSTSALAQGLAAGNLALLTVGAPGAAGGEPIMVDGKVIGGLGISGGTAQQDGEVASLAVSAVK